MDNNTQFLIQFAREEHAVFANLICEEMESSAKARGTGIAKRSPNYIIQKMQEGKAVIAFTSIGRWAGFCYIETWSHGKYVANSGLIVIPELRNSGLAKRIKEKIFELSRSKYPEAKIFGLTTGLAVMKINSELGYKPVTYSELTDEESFWNGCKSCINYEILVSKERKNCLCTAMLFDPAKDKKSYHNPNLTRIDFESKKKIYDRWMRMKKNSFLNGLRKQEEPKKKKKSLIGLLGVLLGF
jgi:hypothetical protein